MRKALLTAIAALVMVGIAQAVPAGAGGSFYLTEFDVTNKQYLISYVDIGTDWQAVSGKVGFAQPMTCGVAITTTRGAVNPDVWFDSTTGYKDMNGSYHNATLILTMRYDNTDDALSNQGTSTAYKGYDILLVKNSGVSGSTITTLNGGWTPTTTASAGYPDDTGSWHSFAAVDSGFTPNGEARGYFIQGGYTRTVWVADASETHVAVTKPFESPTAWQYGTKYASLTKGTGWIGAVDSNDKPTGTNDAQVTGVVVMSNDYVMRSSAPASASNYYNQMFNPGWLATYKLKGVSGTAGYRRVAMVESDAYWTDYLRMVGSNPLARTLIADTDNDGVVDVYYATTQASYHGSTAGVGTHNVAHAEDLNGDGDWIDQGETKLMPGLTANNYLTYPGGNWSMTTTITQTPSGLWVIMWYDAYNTSGNESYSINVVGLDAYGDWDGTKVVVASYSCSNAGTNGAGDSTLRSAPIPYGNQMSVVFDPLWAYGDPLGVPEPATMMLVGTGVLTLAGVLRRRLLG